MKEYVIDGKVVNVTLESGKVVKIATQFLEKMVANLDVDMEEAVLIWLEDEGYIINEEQEEMTEKAKENKIQIGAKDNSKKAQKKTRTVKTNPTKEMIIAEIEKAVAALDGVSNVVVENKGKIITFSLNGENFKVDLVQKRSK